MFSYHVCNACAQKLSLKYASTTLNLVESGCSTPPEMWMASFRLGSSWTAPPLLYIPFRRFWSDEKSAASRMLYVPPLKALRYPCTMPFKHWNHVFRRRPLLLHFLFSCRNALDLSAPTWQRTLGTSAVSSALPSRCNFLPATETDRVSHCYWLIIYCTDLTFSVWGTFETWFWANRIVIPKFFPVRLLNVCSSKLFDLYLRILPLL